jgi:hypothetical protein
MVGRGIRSKGVRRSPVPVSPGQHPVSLMGTYLALRLLESREEVAAAVAEAERTLLAEAHRKERGQFISKARSGMSEAMVSFSRDDLDISYATVMFAASPGAILRGVNTWVPAGYFEYRSRYGRAPALRYVDRSLPWSPADRGSVDSVLLDPSRTESLLTSLLALSDRAVVLVTPQSDGHALSIELAPAVVGLLSERSPLFHKGEVTASLVSDSRSVAIAPLRFEGRDGGFDIPSLAAERLMELQAASARGLWICLEHPELRVLAPLPDLFTPGSRADAFFEPVAAFRGHLGGTPACEVAMPSEIARLLARRFPWVAATDPSDWRSLQETDE